MTDHVPSLPDRSPSRDPGVRVSDAERQRTVELLRTHTADGRLTLDEFSDRVGDVYAAITSGDLDKVTGDLPAVAAPVVPETSRRKPTRWTVSFLGANRRKGRWRVAPRSTSIAFLGGTQIDLRNAEFDSEVIDLVTISFLGGVQVVVPDGVDVELTGIAVLGGKHCRIRPVPRAPGTPLVRVHAYAFLGAVNVRTKKYRTPEARAQRELERQQRHGQRRARRSPALPTGDPALSAAPARAAMPLPPDGTVTILFTDIEESTELFERIGDGAARRVLAEHNRLVRAEVAANDGHEVKCNGDGFMIVFSSAAKALRCATALQRRFADFEAEQGAVRVRVRMGLHTGEVEAQDGDFVGRAVTLASRVADVAAGGEVLVSSLVRELAGGNGDFAFDDGRSVDLKGLAGPHVVYALDWKG